MAGADHIEAGEPDAGRPRVAPGGAAPGGVAPDGAAPDRAALARAALEEAERVARSRSADSPAAPRDGAETGSGSGRWGRADGDPESGSDHGDGASAGRAGGRRWGSSATGSRRGGNQRRGGGFGSSGQSSKRTDGDDEGSGEKGPPANPEQLARNICLRLLTLQPRTRAELAAALAKREVPPEAAEAVLDRFSEVGLIDDAAFARAWVETRQRGRGLGRSALAGELRKKGVDREIMQEALESIDADDDLAAAQRLVAKKLPSTRGLAPDKRARRLVGMLARRGHPAGLAYRVVRDAIAAEGADPDLAGIPDPTLSDD